MVLLSISEFFKTKKTLPIINNIKRTNILIIVKKYSNIFHLSIKTNGNSQGILRKLKLR